METLKELLSVGKQYFESKQYAQAESYLKRALEKSGRYADVLNMLGVISHVEGRFASSIDYFQKALEINPRYTEAILNLAVLYNDLGQYADAKKLYGSLKSAKGPNGKQIEPVLRGKLANLHADIGDIYRSIGLYAHAIDEYKKALVLNPGYFDIRTKLGQALRDQGNTEESLKELKAVIKADATYAPALTQMGITYYTMGKIADAKRSWLSVLERNASDETAQMYLRLCERSAQEKGSAPEHKVPSRKVPASPHKKKR